jgi:acetolactate synthase-1/2/3 large subunit
MLFTGDGSFHMNLNEIATAVRYELPVVILIMNNGVLGMVRQWQSLFYDGRHAETTLNRPTDYVKLAEAFGATGYKVANLSELHQALQIAFNSEGPVLIDCPIDPDASVYPIIPPGGSYNDMIIA